MGGTKELKEIKDANGKTFSIDISKISDINGDLGDHASASIADRLQNRVAHVHDVVYVNQAGEVIDNLKLLKDMANGKEHVTALDVEMEATHSGKNHNYCVYYEDSMEKDAESFVNPFRKPMLKNHNSYSEPLGRIIQSWYGPSALTDERSAIHLKTRVTDRDAIEKFLDGRYGTVSIGGTMGTVTCNICGKTILKDGKFKFCGHWRGEVYKDEVCYWGAKDIMYHEVSTVNNPADDFAQIMKVTVVTDSDNKKDSKEDTQMPKVNNTDSKSVDTLKTKVCDMIDELLGVSATDTTATTSSSSVSDKLEEPKDDNTNVSDTSTATDADVDIEDATVELEKAKSELLDAQQKITELTKQLEEANTELQKTKDALTASEETVTQFKDKCITLASTNKELIADGIIKKEKIADDKKEARKAELLAMSMKDLNKLAEESDTTNNQPRTPASVSSPALSLNDDLNVGKDGDESHKKQAVNVKAKKTVDDFAQDIVNKLVK